MAPPVNQGRRKIFENVTGFDKENWPDMADPTFGSTVYRHFGLKPYRDEAA